MLVRQVAAARQQSDTGFHSGVISEPYRDYRGELVLSAWRWLPELEIGFATEADAAEILTTLNMVDTALLGLLGCVGLIGAWGVVSSGWLLRFRGELDRRSELGAYTLIEKIGEGGMGEVFLAHHTLLKRTAALKLLRRDRSDEYSIGRFETEVRIASHLRHPNTVEIYDFGRARDGTFYCAMEYLPGKDLTEWIKRSGRMPVERTIHVVRQICSALTEAHAEGLLHRDVKPGNVMLCSMGGLFDFVKLLDFGLALSLRGEAGGSGRPDSSGTPYYTAPECLWKDGRVDARSDVYSLGVLWFFLLTARLPHSAGVHWVDATLTMEPIPVSSFLPVDGEVEELIMGCVAREPRDRPESTMVLLSRLDALARRLPWTETEARQAWLALQSLQH